MPDLLSPQYQTQPTNAGQVTQLPPGTQYSIDQAMLQKALAQAMLQRGMQQPEGQTIVTGGGAPNRYVAPSMLQRMGGLANTVAGVNALGVSNQNMLKAMQGYQGNVNDIQSQAAQIMAGNPPGPGQSSGPTAGGQQPAVSASQVRDTYIRYKTSGVPALMAEADKMVPLLGELQKNESSLAFEQRKAAFQAAAPAADAQSVIEGAQNGFDITKLKPMSAQPAGTPAGPDTTATGVPGQTINTTTGLVSTAAPGTGVITTTQGLPSRLTEQAQAAQQRALLAEQEKLRGDRQDVVDAGYMGATAGAFREIINSGLANTGALAQDVTKLQQYSKLLGHDVPPNTPYSQIAHQLALSFIGAAKASAGFQGRLSTQEATWLRESSGQTLEQQPQALMTYADNAIAYANQRVRQHQNRVDIGARQAPKVGLDPDSFSALQISPGDIPAVSSGLPPGGAPHPAAQPPGYNPVSSNRRIFLPNGQPAPGQ